MTEPLSMDQAFIRKLTDIVLANLENENFGAEQLAKEAGMSRISLYRKLRSVKREDISRFIRGVRLEKALEMLQNNEGTASEIAFGVGFGSPTYFSKCFHDQYGYPPGEARKRDPVSPENVPAVDPAAPEGLVHQSGLNKNLPPAGRPLNYRRILLISGGILVCLCLIFLVYSLILNIPGRPLKDGLKDPVKSIVVLPFKNLSEDKGNQYFADGVMNEILNNLKQVSELRVVSALTAEQFRNTTLTAPEIARKLHVDYALDGNIQRDENKVRINVQLSDARKDKQLWSQPYDRKLTDVFSIQGDIALQVANALDAVLSPEVISKIEEIPTINPEAYNFYLYGRFFLNKRTKEGFQKSVDYFEKAVSADTVYALAYAGLADAYFLLTYYGSFPRPEGYEKAKGYASQALKIDSNLAEAHTVMGALLCYHEWKWEEARQELKKAVKLKPNFVTAHSYYYNLLFILRENSEARIQANKALELDPFFPTMHAMSAECFENEGKLKESLNEFNKAIELGRLNEIQRIFDLYVKLGDDMNAVEALKKTFLNNTLSAHYADSVKDIYNKSGITGLLNWLIKLELGKINPNPGYLASRFAMLGNKAQTLNWLEKAYDEKYPAIPKINNVADYEFLRSDPRFQALIKKMGLSDYQIPK